ncbi:hypothetical protein BDV96DRAFT_41282 [Lophiotrema nucula]|uniref:Uncharacterized protein n=1 Tax=Lophiotrema nucula TaxID=690887 RepID=A0A6A5ZBI0_9PLEO|nr:hypothetical protein BDV96DRAFT_41282 [Lophiotrema nucula]
MNDFQKMDFDELARLDLNGRQLKSALKTAQLLANKRKIPLNGEVVDIVLRIENRRQEIEKAVSEIIQSMGSQKLGLLTTYYPLIGGGAGLASGSRSIAVTLKQREAST